MKVRKCKLMKLHYNLKDRGRGRGRGRGRVQSTEYRKVKIQQANDEKQ